MNYATSKRLGTIAFWPLIVIGALISLFGLALICLGFPDKEFSAIVVLIGGALGGGTYLKWRSRHRELTRYQTYTYDWYRAKYPDLIRSNRIVCYKCGNAGVVARGLFHYSYTREHVCPQCGTRLYYSSEIG